MNSSSIGLCNLSTKSNCSNCKKPLWSYDVPCVLKTPYISNHAQRSPSNIVRSSNRFTIKYNPKAFCCDDVENLTSSYAHTNTKKGAVTNYLFPSLHLNQCMINALQTEYRKRCANNEVVPARSISIVTHIPQCKSHPDIPYLIGYVSAIAKVGHSNITRLIRVNTKRGYRYNDAMPMKISSDQLIEMYVCMECFDAPEIDLVKFRNGELVTIMTVQRNPQWFKHHKPLIESYISTSYRTTSHNQSCPVSST